MGLGVIYNKTNITYGVLCDILQLLHQVESDIAKCYARDMISNEAEGRVRYLPEGNILRYHKMPNAITVLSHHLMHRHQLRQKWH